MAQQRPVLPSFKKQEIKNVFLGVDFGTSYTKVSYSYAPSNNPQIHTLKWDGDFFKKTELYYQNDRLYFDKPTTPCAVIKYFKYSIIEKKLQNNRQETKCNFEELCCVYFLAQIIKRALTMVFESLKISDTSNINVSVNMGVPLENFYKEKNKNNKGLYLEILENAVTLAGGSKVKASIPNNQVLLSNLDEVYKEILCKKSMLNWSVNVFPELAAELLLYHESKFIPEGLYAIIDIGGGTVDMALFQKYFFDNVPFMYCLKEDVLPYGVEVLQNNKNEQALKSFQKMFSELLMEPKEYVNINYSGLKKIDVFFLGGGAEDPWYWNGIVAVKNRLRKAGIPNLNLTVGLQSFIKTEESLIQKNQRLIISQMLARHISDITEVKGYPDWFEKPLETEITLGFKDSKAKLFKRAKDMGWLEEKNNMTYSDIMYERARESGWNE